MSNLVDLMHDRLSQYILGKNVNLSKDEIVDAIKEVLALTPSAFNAKSQRLLVLAGEAHDKFWDLTMDALEEVTGGASQETKDKNKSFKDAYMTVLVFKDNAVVEALQEKFPLYAENFVHWSIEESGYLQHALWLRFVELGLGASLQHYNPIVDERVREEFDVPESWKLIGQLVVGSVETEGTKKDRELDESRIIVK